MSDRQGLRIGVDFGGTKIEAIALEATGDEVLRRRIPTPRDDYPGAVAAVEGGAFVGFDHCRLSAIDAWVQ